LPIADVIVGAVPFAHLIAAGQVTDLGVPSAVNIKVNDAPEPLAGTFVMVMVVIAAFKLTVKIFDVSKFNVSVPLVIVGLETDSL
jgi:predicted SpoU family rRNA methylase